MLKLFFALTGLFITSIASAQFCGTPQEPLLERVDALKKSPAYQERSAQKYIPVTFHLVASSSGTGRVNEENVLLQIANLNAQYADQQAIFYIDHFNYFDNDAVYNTPASPAATTQMKLRRDNNALNLFITNTAENGGGSPGVTLAYYEPTNDWVVAKKDQISGGSSTVAHEFGHFFSLAHPFSGWDCHPYTFDEYTNPVNVDFTLACDGGGGSELIELQNGSNCNIAGDHVCDTPADYNLGLLFQNDCDTNTVVMDKNGQLIKPMTNNFMSYYRGCASYAFTPNQKTLINASFFSTSRQYIRTGVVPNTTPVTGPVVYISPINGEHTPGITSIPLEWEDTPGANKYMILLAQNPSFTINQHKYFSNQSSFIVTDVLTEGKTYYWKVWPYNESQTGAGYSPTQTFVAGGATGINEIKEINHYSLSPNPIHTGEQSTFTVTSNKTFDGDLTLSDASGRILSNEKINIPSGTSDHPLSTEGYPAGIYFVMLHGTSGSLVERLLITE